MAQSEEQPVPMDYARVSWRKKWVYFGSWHAWFFLLVPVAGLLVGIIWPAMSRARQQALVCRCLANLRQIGLAMELYADGHAGNYPPNLDVLVKQGYVTTNVLVCPAATSQSNGFSYTYIPVQSRRSDSGDILVYEPLTNHGGQSGNVVFVGGRVEHLTAAQHQAAIGQTRSNLSEVATRPAASSP